MEIGPLFKILFRTPSCLLARSFPQTCLRSQRNSRRYLSQTSSKRAEIDTSTPDADTPSSSSALSQLSANLRDPSKAPILDSPKPLFSDYLTQRQPIQPYHLHVFSTKHNTHITLSKPDRNPIFSVSCGNLGFRKSNRGTYDASYQLGAYVMNRIAQQGLLTKIEKLELILRGYGPGRDAMSKILLGSEGMMLRQRISKVTDATRLKFGGTRSKKPRRL